MHELAIARALLAVAERHLPAGDIDVRGLRVAVGGASGVVPAALDLAFRAATADTRFAGARLTIEVVPGRSRCADCATEFQFEGLIGQCPACGAPGGALLAGDALELRAIEVADV
jgi:hydrogenase nickel incorporation protein HypA/HybF